MEEKGVKRKENICVGNVIKMRLNKPQSYALVNLETKKIVKHLGRLQYFRTKQLARFEKKRLQRVLNIKIELIKIKNQKKENE